MSDRIAQFSALVTQQPENALFRFSLAQALQSAGSDRQAEAIEHYQLCVEARADWMMPRILLGKLLISTGKAAKARPILEEALSLAIRQDHEEPAAELRGILDNL
ncbi:molecular chaperone DnaJ [Verrucomicrobia bacterium IMCC26134]|nr:molecular chaperone DnaJ [Verrucomicrobia bacterium IMCC26134]